MTGTIFQFGEPWETESFSFAVISITILALSWYGVSYCRPKQKTTKPPRVPYWLPWIGSALDMGKDPDAFFERASSNFGQIFKVKIAGQDMTYVTSPEQINTVFRDPKTFEFTPIRLDMTHKVFGVSHSATYSSAMTDQYLPIHHRGLSQNRVPDLLERYTNYARESILRAVEQFDEHHTPLIPFMVHAVYSSAAHALFGRSFDATKSYGPFRRFDESFHLLAAGVPQFLLPGPFRAREEIGMLFERYLEKPHDDCCEFLMEIETTMKNEGWSNRDIAKAFAADLWAMEANAPWAGYWTIVLALKTPKCLTSIIEEVDLARKKWQKRHPNELIQANLYKWLSDADLPLLMSAIQESLRHSTSVFSIRRVSEPVVFGGYHFEAGEVITCATRAVHFDEEIHPEAREFVPERYMKDRMQFKKNGKVIPNHSMPFGGGVSMCEGRHFALGELKIFLGLLLSYATIDLDPESTTDPTYYKQRMGTGVMYPKGDLNVKIRKRNVM